MSNRVVKLMAILACFIAIVSCSGTKKAGKGKKNSATKLVEKIEAQDFDFNTFYGRGKISYNDGSMSIGGSLKLKILNDEKIWVSVGKFGFEGVRALITKDSIYAINRLEKKYVVEPLSVLQDKYQLPATINHVQQFLLGKCIVDSTSTISQTDTNFVVKTHSGYSKLTTWLSKGLAVTHLEAMDEQGRTMTTALSNAVSTTHGDFLTKRKVQATYKDKVIKSEINFSKVTWDGDLTFDYTVPSNYKREKL